MINTHQFDLPVTLSRTYFHCSSHWSSAVSTNFLYWQNENPGQTAWIPYLDWVFIVLTDQCGTFVVHDQGRIGNLIKNKNNLQKWDKSSNKHIQSTLVISKSKGPSETLRDIRTSTYQMCRTEENINRRTKFHKWTRNLTPLVRNICWKYCGKWEKLLLRSNFSPYPQYFITWC